MCVDMLSGNLRRSEVHFKNEDSKCVYIVPKGYPMNTRKNVTLVPDFLSNLSQTNVSLIVAGVDHICSETGTPTKHGRLYDETLTDVFELKSDTNVETAQPFETAEFEMSEVVVESQTNTQRASKKESTSKLLTTGSRVFALCAVGKNGIMELDRMLNSLRMNEEMIDNFYFRTDIGHKILNETDNIGLYAKAGVNIDSKNEAVKSIHSIARQSYNDYVINNEGGFGGLIRLPPLCDEMVANGSNWVLVNSTDSVGSKSIFVRKWWGKTKGMESLGHDIVNHCVNDILVQSPSVLPWTFLDYYATHHLGNLTQLHY